jgi:glutamate formiminotransferase
MRNLIESVPNFSEGRDQQRIQALVAAMSGIAGAAVLDCHSDADHNRSVITLAGEPEAVAEAALRGVGKAAELIDLTRHAGVHPRMGAADVLPFVPVEGWTLAQCAELAHRAGREIWERFRIPVYFYGAAALQESRVLLENVRRGQFEGLREAVLLLPGRAPDIGGPGLHPTAGAVAVGARSFLIACNVNLRTADLGIAKKIARTIRASSGGLPAVKAMGVALERRGLVQVSINLTDFSQTPLPLLFERVRLEAERHHCAVEGYEIVGLAPREAFIGLDGIAGFMVSPAQILENRIAALLPSTPPAESASNEDALEGIPLKGAPTR